MWGHVYMKRGMLGPDGASPGNAVSFSQMIVEKGQII